MVFKKKSRKDLYIPETKILYKLYKAITINKDSSRKCNRKGQWKRKTQKIWDLIQGNDIRTNIKNKETMTKKKKPHPLTCQAIGVCSWVVESLPSKLTWPLTQHKTECGDQYPAAILATSQMVGGGPSESQGYHFKQCSKLEDLVNVSKMGPLPPMPPTQKKTLV